MNKKMKNVLLSILATATAATAVAGVVVSNVTLNNTISADAAVGSASGFEMVDGAGIRMANPLGLRFIAEMNNSVYTDLMTAETGVEKKMGMFIVPYDFLDGVSDGNYQNIETKLDYEFYNSTKTYEAEYGDDGMIYSHTEDGVTTYRANGVITNLKLQNYDREFIGIGYIAETTSSGTTYTFADFNEADNVRTSAYVAVEAYADKDKNYSDNALAIFNEYAWGAHLKAYGMTVENGVYTYNGTDYSSISDVTEGLSWKVSLDKTTAYVKKVGESVQLTATVQGAEKDVTFNGAHVIWSSSDESILTVDENGNITTKAKGSATVTATFMGKSASCEVIVEAVTFENGVVPSYFTKAGSTESLSVVEMATTDGEKALKIQSTASGTTPALYATIEFLASFFEDESVDYIAFDAKTGVSNTNNFRRSTIRTTGTVGSWGQEPYESDYAPSDTGPVTGVRYDAYKTFYFSRLDYENWVNNSKTSELFITAGGMDSGDCIYVDNIRCATEEDYLQARHSLDNGGTRTNGGNLLMYIADDASTWQLGVINGGTAFAADSFGYSSEIVSDGARSFWFKTTAGETATVKFKSTSVDMYTGIAATGYYAFDLYVPAGADTTLTYQTTTWPGVTPKENAWTTIYVNNSAQVLKITDTTGSKYYFDNFRSVTADEYTAATLGFEANVSGLRDNVEASNVFYYYGGADHTANKYSFAVTGTPLESVRFDGEIVHGGDYSLAFTKETGAIALQMRADSTTYSLLKQGFTFWIYSTVGLNGISADNFINGNSQKLNGGEGMSVGANTWTKIVVTADDIKHATTSDGACPFLRIQGSTAGTIYLDDFQPIDASKIHTVTFDAAGGTVSKETQTLISGEAYTLPTASSYRDFTGWVDEDGNEVASSGVWNYTEDVTLTATYADKVSFEGGVVPSYFTKADSTESLSVVEMDTTDGEKALKIQSTASGTTPALYATIEFLASFFEDESVDYIAFEARTGVSTTDNFRRHTWRSLNGGEYVNVKYEADTSYSGIRSDAFKTFYFSRTDYNHWVTEETTENYFISSGGITAGDSIYVDNIRPATAEDYTNSLYSNDNAGFRLDGNNILVFKADDSTWQWCILPGTALTSYGLTNETVSDGVAAVSFTPVANTTTTLRFNTNSVTQMQTDIMNKTGYYAFDLYVPEGSDVTLTYQTTTYPGVTPKKGGWTTIYVNNSTTFIKLTDTTGSTYAVDNFRSVTADEYTAATLGFEAGAGGLRDGIETNNAFYYYGGADHTANTYSICASGSTLTEVDFDSEIVHGGDYSLAFTKTNGALALQMRKDSAAYALLQHGFTFWIYSTVGLNGISANNFINGNSQKLNGGEGMSVSANTWTQVTVTEADITHSTESDGPCPFLRLNGSTAGTIYLDDFVALPYEEPEVLTYNTTVEEDDDGVRYGITLAASSHTYSNSDALPQDTADTEDMSYIKFGGSYGLNDFLVFDFTGDNVPLMSFFNSEVSNTIYNQAENADVKGWIVANGMTTMKGLTYGGLTGAHANRLTFVGPYKISYKFDDNGTGTELTQVRASEGSAASPSPISMATLQDKAGVPFRMIVGWVENGDYMNLRMYVIDLTTGQAYVDYNLNKSIAKADWEGDIALYGHFGRETYVDALYPIEEDTTIDEVIEKYAPSTVVYNGTWDGDGGLTLNQSIYNGGDVDSDAANSPTSADMSYIAFNGTYGLNDYVVFDMTGDNMPIVSFFNNEVTNTVFNNASAGGTIADESVRGWVWFNGLYKNNGVVYGYATTSNVHWQRLTLIGSHKVVGFDNNNNDFRVCLGSATDVNPLSIYALQSVTDTYRIILGVGKNASSTSKVYMEMAAINMVTGNVVYQKQWEVSSVDFEEGSIALHGQFGKKTVLDKVFGVEEDTTLSALIAKYAKDTDYSDETAVTLDRYAYSSLSDGQWTLDGTDQVTDPTDYRTVESSYTTYANAGFNIVLAQDMISTDGTKATWEASANKTYMDNAYNAGLKVILTDWHLQILSAPIKVTSSGAVASDSTYVPWIIGTDASATTGAAADYLGYLSSLGITVDSTRFATRDALDKFIYDQLAPYKDHPAFYGVMLADEPSYHNAYCYGEIYKSIKRVMPDCYVQYNLLPLEDSFGTIQYRYPGVNDIGSGITNAQIETAYKSYVESFLDTMGTDYIQYDDYPFKSTKQWSWSEFSKAESPYVDVTSLRNIQLIAEIAKERDLDVKVVTQSLVAKSGGANSAVHIRQITENDARWLNNYLMGFGVKQINYFTYWTKRASTSSGEYFVDGGSFVNRDGTTTDLYKFMQTIMADNTAFAPTIMNFDYNASQVFGSDNNSNLNNEHISWSSSLTEAASFRWITGVTTSLEYTLVTELYDKDNYNYMYMVMNTIDPNSGGTQTITVTLDSSVTKFYVYDQSGNNRTLVEGNTYTVSLTAGQAIYIMPCAW